MYKKIRHNRQIILILFITFSLLGVKEVAAAESTAPDLKLNTPDGVVSLRALRNQVVYVDFWASWCAPCRKSFPWMNQMQKRYGNNGFKIIAVNVDSDQRLARQFLEEHQVGFTVAFDPDGKAASAFKVKGMPSSYLIDRQGFIHSSHIGFREKDINNMEDKIKILIKQ